MRAAVLAGVDPVLEIRDVPDPTPGPDDLLLRVAACGICGSDLHMATQLKDLPGMIFGHEFCGEVIGVGTAVQGWAEGDRVAAFPLYGCGQCPACATGEVAKCAGAELIGAQRPGAYAEYVTVNATEAYRLPENLDDRHGALVEPLAVALHALDMTPRRPGAPMLILGAGPVGLAVAMWARHLGAGEVVLSDPAAGRRGLADTMGFATVDPAADDVGDVFRAMTGSAPETVIECVGVPGLIQHSVDLVAADGDVTVVGVCMEPDTITPLTAMFKEATLRFVIYYRRRDFSVAIDQMSSGRFDPLALVTATVDLDQAPARFESLMDPSDDCKVLITP